MDSLDRRLVHALYVDGRAPFSRIAEVLGASDQMVARRYHRLGREAGLRVLGRLDARRPGEAEWVVRLRCAPGASHTVAGALAGRADTRWVRLASGGTEVVCVVQADSGWDRDAFLPSKLPATRSVTAISAYAVMHVFRGGPTSWQGVTRALSDDEVAGLTPPPPDPGGTSGATGPTVPSEGDRALLDELGRDGRATLAALAAATGWHEATVRRRIAQLRASGVLYFDIDVEDRVLGYSGTSLLWITMEPAQLSAAGEELARHPQVAFAAATTGPSNLLASVLCPDVRALYHYIGHQVGPLPGIRAIESAPIIRTVKRAGPIGDPGRD
ncbi:Lrp/AsnC family transcriptional regulator [Streptacidiphilus sp. 4-A2]|nr:Lrp/AsnC family transcriptional regulator [Streptacidiphilus sp. 4-A2]